MSNNEKGIFFPALKSYIERVRQIGREIFYAISLAQKANE